MKYLDVKIIKVHSTVLKSNNVQLTSPVPFFRTSTTNFASQQWSSISDIGTMSNGTWANSPFQLASSEFLFIPHSSHVLIAQLVLLVVAFGTLSLILSCKAKSLMRARNEEFTISNSLPIVASL